MVRPIAGETFGTFRDGTLCCKLCGICIFCSRRGET